MQRWHALTAIPEPPQQSSFVQREAGRRSQMTSNVLLFFSIMVLSLLPGCYFVPYPSYFWLDLGLFLSCLIALWLNRGGKTTWAGVLVTLTSFTALTAALFSTIPFDETTLQGYDMYIIVELLAVSLLPRRGFVFVVFIASVACIIVTTFFFPHTPALDQALNERLVIILARPIGTLFMLAGGVFILAETMAGAIKREGQAEMIAKLERENAEQKRDLEIGIEHILRTHVEIANGNLSARAPLSEHNVLWKIARALNQLLVRHQRAVRAEEELKHVEQAIWHYIKVLQEAEQNQQTPILPAGGTKMDPLIMLLQGKTIGQAPFRQESGRSSLEPPYQHFPK